MQWARKCLAQIAATEGRSQVYLKKPVFSCGHLSVRAAEACISGGLTSGRQIYVHSLKFCWCYVVKEQRGKHRVC